MKGNGNEVGARRGRALRRWTTERAKDLYGVREWGAGFFDISDRGEVVMQVRGHEGRRPAVSLKGILDQLRERDLGCPVLLRFEDLLEARIRHLNESFRRAMSEAGYRGAYRGVYPVKVNQQQQVVEDVTRYGRAYHHGLEVGSKAELLAALAYMHDPDALIVCNGYKDEEFVDLALLGLRLGLRIVLVVEMPGEVHMILERAAGLGVEPLLGVRLRLATRATGHWTESGGDESVFGLDCAQVVALVDDLKASDALKHLVMLHYHLGSQVPNIRDLRAAAAEGMRVYVELVGEGAAMGYFNAGGGLAVDYDGSRTNFASSCNYGPDEYTTDLVEVVMSLADQAGVEHPVLVTESGRALVAYASVLVFNILDVARFERQDPPLDLSTSPHEPLQNLDAVGQSLHARNVQESFHDALYYRDELRALFQHGGLSLRERAEGERLFWSIVVRIARLAEDLRYVPEELKGLHHALADVYYGNFSLFQSLPDAWAIDQLFPVMPLHRLDEEPTRRGILSDSTCDCDGKIDHFIDLHDVRRVLPLHPLKDGEDYLLGVFLVGAYQETLGDLHNLFGDTHVVGVRLDEAGEVEFTRVVEGDTVSDVLSYVEYDLDDLPCRFEALAARAVEARLISPAESGQTLEAFRQGLAGYTYFER